MGRAEQRVHSFLLCKGYHLTSNRHGSAPFRRRYFMTVEAMNGDEMTEMKPRVDTTRAAWIDALVTGSTEAIMSTRAQYRATVTALPHQSGESEWT